MDIDLMFQVYPFFLQAAWTTIVLSVLTALLGLVCGALGAASISSRMSLMCVSFKQLTQGQRESVKPVSGDITCNRG